MRHLSLSLLLLVGFALLTPLTTRAAEPKPSGHLQAFSSQAELDRQLAKWRREILRRERTMRAKYAPVAMPTPPPSPVMAEAAPVAAAAASKEDSYGLDAISVTGAPVAAAEPGITNVQVQGVDEGGIVKRHGDHLVILRRGRLFTVRVGGDALQPVSTVDAYASGGDPASWYDEMLISGDRIVVIGFSYRHGGGATEVGVFDIDGAGKLAYRDIYFLRSNDYYSSRNYASRLIGSTLIFYTPLELDPWGDALMTWPGLDRWRGREVPANYKRLLPAQEIYRADAGLDPYNDEIALHTVTRCELKSLPMQCSSRAVLGPAGRVFYVSRDAVYVWTVRDSRPNERAASGVLVRMPLDTRAPSSLQVRGAPIDQMSFHEAGGFLNVLLEAEGRGESMWRSEWAEGRLALMRVPLSRFGTLAATAPREAYRVLPMVAEGERHARFVGDWLLYSGYMSWQSRSRGMASAYALRYAEDGLAFALPVTQGVQRIEAMGSDALLVGNDESDLVFSGVALDRERARLQGRYVLPQAMQGESRTHGFFYRRDDAESGVVGLPVLRQAPGTGETKRYDEGLSASVAYLRNQALSLQPLGELAAKPALRDDACKASCVDWYGNARPIFIGDRVFALMGYELVEGRIEDGAVKERRRVDFAPGVVVSP